MEKSKRSPLPIVPAYTIFNGIEVKELTPSRYLIASLFDIATRAYQGTPVESQAYEYYQGANRQAAIDQLAEEQDRRLSGLWRERKTPPASQLVASRGNIPVGMAKIRRLQRADIIASRNNQGSPHLQLRHLGDLAITDIIIDPEIRNIQPVLEIDLPAIKQKDGLEAPDDGHELYQALQHSLAHVALKELAATHHPMLEQRIITTHDEQLGDYFLSNDNGFALLGSVNPDRGMSGYQLRAYRSRSPAGKILSTWDNRQAINPAMERTRRAD